MILRRGGPKADRIRIATERHPSCGCIMAVNPYSPPTDVNPTQTPIPLDPHKDRPRLYDIARYQRGLRVVAAGMVLFLIIAFSRRESFLELVYVVLEAAAVAYLFLLARALYRPSIACVVAVVAPFFYFNLIAVFVLDRKATRELRAFGFRGGIFGANLKEIAGN